MELPTGLDIFLDREKAVKKTIKYIAANINNLDIFRSGGRLHILDSYTIINRDGKILPNQHYYINIQSEYLNDYLKMLCEKLNEWSVFS